jgi:hypothetical protein
LPDRIILLAGANVFTDSSTGNVRGSLFGGLNVVTKNGNGNINVAMYGGINALIQVHLLKTLMPMLDRCQLWLKN